MNPVTGHYGYGGGVYQGGWSHYTTYPFGEEVSTMPIGMGQRGWTFVTPYV
jgi:hypothetical protein